MSTDPNIRGTIPVAPREIVDLITRICRVNGIDAGTAADLANGVMSCAAEGQPAIGYVLSRIDDGSMGELTPPHSHRALPDEQHRAALRNGIAVEEADFRALERAAADFLVAEATLDSIADELTID